MSGVTGTSLVTGHTVEHTYTHGTPTHGTPSFLSSSRERILRSQLINHRVREKERKSGFNPSATYISFPPKIESSTLLPHSYHSSPSSTKKRSPKTRPFRSRCHTARATTRSPRTRDERQIVCLFLTRLANLQRGCSALDTRDIAVDGRRKREPGATKFAALPRRVASRRVAPRRCLSSAKTPLHPREVNDRRTVCGS